MLQVSETPINLLSPHDPEPVDIVRPEGQSVFVLACEHAGRAIPAALGDLGLVAAEAARHIAWDIGAEGLSRRLSDLLGAPLILQRYSRLVIDCNRPVEAPDCIPTISDGTQIPANGQLTAADRQLRFEAIHRPFHEALSQLLDRRAEAEAPVILVALHSFTPRLIGGPERPWHLGVLWNRDRSFADKFLAAFQAHNPNFASAHNEPYVVDDQSDYTIPVHGEARGLPHLLLEIRNDLIADDAGQERWAKRIAQALKIANKNDDPNGR